MSPTIKKASKTILTAQPTKMLLQQKLPSAATDSTLASTISAIRAPTPDYLKLVDSPPSVALDPEEAGRRKKHLLILDLNGTLVSRTKKRNGMFVRPHIDTFLDYIFAHFKVMVWSSAQPTSVNHMLLLFGEERRAKIVRAWNRTHFGLSSAAFHNKSPTIKDLQRVWERFTRYNAHTTVILDDSPSKSVLQPFNSIHVDTFDHSSDAFLEHGDQELLSVVDYLKRIQNQTNIPNFMRNTPYASSSSSHNQSDNSKDMELENKSCYYYAFRRDVVPERWDFSKIPVQIEKVGDYETKATHIYFS